MMAAVETRGARNAEIQRLVKYVRNRYSAEIHERLLVLGLDVFIWQPGGGLDWSAAAPVDEPRANERRDSAPAAVAGALSS